MSTSAKKLVDAGKPIPQASVTLPPLVTPAGTSITLGPGPGQATLPNTVPVSNGPAITNGTSHSRSSTAEAQDEENVSRSKLAHYHSQLLMNYYVISCFRLKKMRQEQQMAKKRMAME